jgi:hypothetical protein
MRIAVVFAAYAVVALAGVGLFATMLGAAACSENLHPGTTRTEVCTKIGLDGPGYTPAAFLYAFGPALVFVLLLALLPLARRHFIATTCAITVAAIAGYIVVLRLAI